MSDGLDNVRRICEGWPDLSADDWREICTPDVRYQNMPWDRVIQEGPDAIHEVLSGFAENFTVEMDVTHLGGDDTVVFSERTEHFTPRGAGGEAFDLPVTGVFELRDGKVSAWRDYFDRRAMKT